MGRKTALVRRQLGDDNSKEWRYDQKYEACANYLINGNLQLVSRTLKIPYQTLRLWKSQDWWQEALEELKEEVNVVNSSKLQGVINTSLGVLEDRLNNGDFYYNKSSKKLERIGVSANVANKVTSDLIQRKVLIDNLNRKSTASEIGIAERLKSLQEEFLKFAKSKVIESEPINIIGEKQ